MPQYLSPGVYVREVESGSRPIEGVGTALAAFVGLAAKGKINTPVLVTNWSQFTEEFGEFVEDSYMAHAVYGYFNNGGGACYVVRIGSDNGPVAARAELTSAAGASAYSVVALEAGEAGQGLSVEIADEDGDEESFRLIVKNGSKVEETFERVTVKRGKQNVATVVNEKSALIRLEETKGTAGVDKRPASGAVKLNGGGPAEPAPITTSEYIGSPAERSGIGGLAAIDGVTMVCAPDIVAAYERGAIDADGLAAMQRAMVDHCEAMGDRMAILDPPRGLNPQQIGEWRVASKIDSKFAALYWPWVRVFDPSKGQTISVPPSGHMAGIWGRSDDERGVHKAPANEVVRGALDLDVQITRAEHDQLNPIGVNCLRTFNGRGIRVWGARTMSSDTPWTYVNVRRLFNYVESSLLEGMQWVVFEPNDLDLWQRIRRTCTAFLTGVWRDGALFGATPEEAFFVKCDAETNTPDLVDKGQVNVQIGIAPVKPAEFVIFSISQYSGGGQVNE
jgi:phage tail sheath protein FI